MSDPLAQPLQLGAKDSIRWLELLLEWYSGQEHEYYQKLWGDGGSLSCWCQTTENEWMRYRQEAAALRAGIAALRSTLGKEVKP